MNRQRTGVISRLIGLAVLVVLSIYAFSQQASGHAPTPAALQAGPTENLVLDPNVKQGEAMKIRIENPREGFESGTAWLAGVKAPLFRQPDGALEGVMPVRVNQKPGGYTFKIQNRNGETLYEKKIEVWDARYSKQNITVTKAMKGRQPEPGELETIARLKTDTAPTRYWSEPFVLPVPDCMNSRFGNIRLHNGVFTDDYHKGIDQRSPAGRPIQATNGGVVKVARFFNLHGGTVGLDHGQGLSSVYIHMSKIAVKPGDIVEKGHVIGQVGATGFATGPHLHWGLFINGLPVNPTQWVRPNAC